MKLLQLLETGIDSVYEYMSQHQTAQEPYFEEMQEEWAGGVGDFGNPKAAYAIQRHPMYYDYKDALNTAIEQFIGDPFIAYRLLAIAQLEAWEQGDDLPPMGVSTSQRHAAAFRRFAANMKRDDLVLVRLAVPVESVIMLGHEGEREFVIDPNYVSFHTITILKEHHALSS